MLVECINEIKVIIPLVSEEPFSQGILGLFNSLEVARQFAEDKSLETTLHYRIYQTSIDQPAMGNAKVVA